MLIDIHVHARKIRTTSRKNGRSYTLPTELLALMDGAGIDKAAIMCRMSPEWGYCYVSPEEVLEMCALYPTRLIPFCNLDPRMQRNSVEADFRPMLQYYKEAGCKGVGEYIPNLPFDDPLQMNVFRQVEEVGLPLTFHVGPTLGGCYGCYDELGLPRLEKVLKECPDLKLLGHSQPFWAEISADVTDETRGGYPTGKVTPGRLVQLMRECPNLYGDLSAGSGCNAITRDPEFGLQFLEEFQDRLLFGTDICYPNQELPIVAFFQRLHEEQLISAEAYEKITWRNANALLGLGLEEGG